MCPFHYHQRGVPKRSPVAICKNLLLTHAVYGKKLAISPTFFRPLSLLSAKFALLICSAAGRGITVTAEDFFPFLSFLSLGSIVVAPRGKTRRKNITLNLLRSLSKKCGFVKQVFPVCTLQIRRLFEHKNRNYPKFSCLKISADSLSPSLFPPRAKLDRGKFPHPRPIGYPGTVSHPSHRVGLS